MPRPTKERMDGASVRNVMVGIIGCTSWLNFIASRLAGAVFSSIIILIVVISAVGAVKFSVEFRRNKPTEIKGFTTLGLSWLALIFSVSVVAWLLYQSLANPALSAIIILVSGIALCSAPMSVLWFNAKSSILQKAKTRNTEGTEHESPFQ